MMNEKELYKMHADFCKFMGNEKRIEILFLLGDSELRVEELANKMEIRVSNVSQHLAVMREKGVVETRREGTKIYYKLTNPKILEACIMMRDIMFSNINKTLEKFN
ncbi:Transcriptional regulator ArsR family protein [Haloplasma contractile SSD-17B]|uniref:Transcriptional regulator ArsR family protein n=2 Tax=Haloplasma TaxID=471824 RepID=U2ED76_9MOLU|nr:Transcriptional regulator ArsR family protein [Haloplasma contractile SSD-17B]